MHLILSALLLLMDVGPKPLSYAGQPTPLQDMKGVDVEMAAEDVTLVLHRAKLDVAAVFQMLNHGADAEFDEGFPVGPFTNMTGFSITIDGRAIPFKLVDRAKPGKEERHDYWYVWSAAFKAGARHTHVVKYSLDLQHQRFYHETGYILHTGAAWKNPIGRASVTLTFGEGASLGHLRGVRPLDAARVQADRVTWSFERFEPGKEHDIVISYGLDTWKDALHQLRKDAPTSWNSRRALAATLKELPTYQGRRTFTPDELRDYLDALAALISEGKMEDGKFVFPAADPEQVSGPPGVERLFEGLWRLRYYLLEDDILRTFQGQLDEVTSLTRAHPAEPKAREVLTLYRDFLRRLLKGDLHLDYRKLAENAEVAKQKGIRISGRSDPRDGKILPARPLKPEEQRTLEAKLSEADVLLK